MSAIDEVFFKCSHEGRAAFIPFLMAGDPDLNATAEYLEALAAGGADIIELGVPFSDPIADGPVNQRAAVRALESGTKLSGILQLVARHRDRLGIPIVLFTYFNPIHAHGVERFAEQAAASGVDGVLCVDLPPDEGERDFIPALREQGVDTVFLLAPTSTRERVSKVGEASTGFVYYVSRTGVTCATSSACASGSTSLWPWASASRHPSRSPRWGRSPTESWWGAPWCGSSRRTRALPGFP
jgi:tryptophan synthase alpha chain